MHHLVRAADAKPKPAFPKHASGYRRFAPISGLLSKVWIQHP